MRHAVDLWWPKTGPLRYRTLTVFMQSTEFHEFILATGGSSASGGGGLAVVPVCLGCPLGSLKH